jgi:hypothetical protein
VKPELKAPFPWFGGKSKVAHMVWDWFGNVDNYVEPFAGSLAVLLGRPHAPQTETVNDLDCYIANFWRALHSDPEAVAHYADWPVNEADLHARHLWLVNQDAFRERMKTDPDFVDVRIAGWWVWGISQWIGSGWCSRPEWTGRTNAASKPRGIQGKEIDQKRPMIHGGHYGKGVHQKLPAVGDGGRGVHRQIPALGDAGRGVLSERIAGPSQQIPSLGSSMGINRGELVDAVWQARPFLTTDGQGVHAKRPHLSGRGTGIGIHADEANAGLYAYFDALAARLRRVRVCCGDWKRVTGPSVTVKHGVCGIFLDPPYDMRVVAEKSSSRGDAPLYANHDNDLSKDVRDWAVENGENRLLRIAVCGYEGEHAFPDSWACVPWKATGGYGSQGSNYENGGRERIWFSPHCLTPGPLFEAL